MDVLQEKRKYTTKSERLEIVLRCIDDQFKSLGHFFEAVTENVPRDNLDPRSEYHKRVLSSWLGGRTAFRPVHLVEAIYRNRYSVPSSKSVQAEELSQSFHGTRDPKEYHFARPGLSTWATQLVGKRCALEVGRLGYNDPAHPNFHVFLQSSANSRMAEKRKTVSQEDVFQFSMQRSADILQSRALLSWFLTESMSATRKKRRDNCKDAAPTSFCMTIPGFLVSCLISSCRSKSLALSSFAMARNRSANAYFALPVGTYLFATKAHTDVKRVFCKLGLLVHDTTVRNALISMGAKRKEALQADTIAALEKKEPAARKNTRQYTTVPDCARAWSMQTIPAHYWYCRHRDYAR
ncbi:hypothetical protein B0H14DRAFT_2410846 [Mycena olivaceomarginata]|nr:hypothetical protein B0H14DRAFT_2410846 [Mycena olivaceomarginata]